VTGSAIASDKPVGVIAGASCARVPPDSGGCVALTEMLLPTSFHGTEFYATPLPQFDPSDPFDFYVVRFMADEDNTTVTVDDGASLADYALDRGQFQELQLGPEVRITSDLPISVMQFAVSNYVPGVLSGGSFAMQILPTSLSKDSYRLDLTGGFANSIIVVAANGVVPTVELNGLPVTGFAPSPGGTHQFVVIEGVSAGLHLVESVGGVLVYVIGFDIATSYGYPAGF
jgi:hypothetical protein